MKLGYVLIVECPCSYLGGCSLSVLQWKERSPKPFKMISFAIRCSNDQIFDVFSWIEVHVLISAKSQAENVLISQWNSRLMFFGTMFSGVRLYCMMTWWMSHISFSLSLLPGKQFTHSLVCMEKHPNASPPRICCCGGPVCSRMLFLKSKSGKCCSSSDVNSFSTKLVVCLHLIPFLQRMVFLPLRLLRLPRAAIKVSILRRSRVKLDKNTTKLFKLKRSLYTPVIHTRLYTSTQGRGLDKATVIILFVSRRPRA